MPTYNEKPERNDRIERRYCEDGVGCDRIAREEGVRPCRVWVILRRRGVTKADRGKGPRLMQKQAA